METPTENKTILLAEDNSDDVLLIRLAMEKIGFAGRLVPVSNGEDALDYLQGKGKYTDHEQFPAPDLVLLDLAMPRMSGLEVLAWVQQHSPWSHVPVVVLSGFGDESAIRRAYDLGAAGFVVKPGEFRELIATMKHVTEFWLGEAAASHSERLAA